MKWPAQKMVGDLLGEVDRAMLNLVILNRITGEIE